MWKTSWQFDSPLCLLPRLLSAAHKPLNEAAVPFNTQVKRHTKGIGLTQKVRSPLLRHANQAEGKTLCNTSTHKNIKVQGIETYINNSFEGAKYGRYRLTNQRNLFKEPCLANQDVEQGLVNHDKLQGVSK